MVRDDLPITIPSLFKCPISLDVMKSPVSLCTGVTYDRSSIQRWLDSGHNTCPATMQVLQTKEFVPNHTLQRLIRIWSDSVQTSPATESNSLSPDQALKLVNQMKQQNHDEIDENSFKIIAGLTSFAVESGHNRKFLAGLNGFVAFLIEIISKHINKIYFVEKIVQLCSVVVEDYEDKQKLPKIVLEKQHFESSMLVILQHGSADSKIATARVLELFSVDLELNILSELIKIVSTTPNLNAIEAVLSCLVSSSKRKQVRPRLVQLRVVKVLGQMLSDCDLSVPIIEKMMKILETVTACKEGRKEICENEECVEAIVKKVLKVSHAATEHGVTILWSLCCLFRDPKAQSAVIKSNGLAKILLLMQSNCSPAVRQMSGDMLKIFRVNSKSCLSSYETKTTHIMPF